MFLRIIFLAFVGLFFILALDNHYNKKSEQAMANVSSTRAKLLHLAMQQVLLLGEIFMIYINLTLLSPLNTYK